MCQLQLLASSLVTWTRFANGSERSSVVREHYLRSDIPCGSELCEKCEPLYSALADGQLSLPSHEDDDMEGSSASRGKRAAGMGPLLSREGRKRTSGGKTDEKGHYLIIDTNVALAQVSCEASRPGTFTNLTVHPDGLT